MNPAFWLNTAWMWKSCVELRAFRQATRAVADAQAALLRSTLGGNRHTEFGHRHSFGTIGSVEQFQRNVPLSTYDTYRQSIERIGAGEWNVLTQERIRLLEPTSGTGGGEKLIPYTRTLGQQFQRAVAAWIADLMSRRPAVRGGRAYWSISPCFGPPRRTRGGIPIGFEDDTAYLSGVEKWLVDRLLAVPNSVAKATDIEHFRYATLLFLLHSENLALVSVWNPTFLTALFARIDDWLEQLCHDIQHGTISLASANETYKRWTAVKPNPRRAARLREVFASHSDVAERFRRIWPRLALVSCWTDAAAAWGLPAVKKLFPDVEIQPKGLVATEAFVSFPLVDRPGAALALRSHFFEFAEIDNGSGDLENTPCRLAHQLDRGGRYRAIVTTGGGLYRYELRDEVEVVGFENQCPLLRFLGKLDLISDLVGEKLSEQHVRAVLARVLDQRGLSTQPRVLVPILAQPPRYRLYLQRDDGPSSPEARKDLAASLQDGLEENPHYRYAVELGQLAPAEIELVDASRDDVVSIYQRRCVAEGRKLGDIKPSALDIRPIRVFS
jgi:hypothetical protein